MTIAFSVRAAFIVAVALATAAAGSSGLVQAPKIYYVRVGATGNSAGSDWANAFGALPAKLERGAVYYIADGAYGARAFDEPTAGSSLITLRKATVDDHGTDRGWLDSYGDGQTLFGPLTFRTSYWMLDGQVRNNSDWSDLDSYGFQVRNSSMSPSLGAVTIGSFGSVVTNIAIRRTAVIGSSNMSSTTNSDDGIRYLSMGGDHAHNSLVTESAVYRPGRDLLTLRGPDDVTIEYSYLAQNRWATTSQHSQAISASEGMHRLTVRYNWFEDIRGEGPLTTAGVNKTGPGASSNWYFYGNLITRSRDEGVGCSRGAGVRIFNNSEHFGDMLVFNNTVARANTGDCFGLEARIFGVEASNVSAAKILVANNLTWRSRGYTTDSSGWSNNSYLSMVGRHVANDANAYVGDADPFLAADGDDFRLALPTAVGVQLPQAYALDMHGHVRGADGIWDHGAFECVGCNGAAPPAPPRNLRLLGALRQGYDTLTARRSLTPYLN